jgi:hypothetical protein
MAYILVIRALSIEDVVQCPLASAGCTSGTRDGWSGGMDLFTGPLLPTLVGLLVSIAPRCWWRGFRSPDEVLSPLVSGDVEVEGQVIRPPVEVLDHCRLSDFEDTVSNGLKPLEVRPKCFIAPAPDGFEVPLLRPLIGEGLKVGDEASTEVAPVVDVVSRQVS